MAIDDGFCVKVGNYYSVGKNVTAFKEEHKYHWRNDWTECGKS